MKSHCNARDAWRDEQSVSTTAAVHGSAHAQNKPCLAAQAHTQMQRRGPSSGAEESARGLRVRANDKLVMLTGPFLFKLEAGDS